jgi:signal peptidase I
VSDFPHRGSAPADDAATNQGEQSAPSEHEGAAPTEASTEPATQPPAPAQAPDVEAPDIEAPDSQTQAPEPEMPLEPAWARPWPERVWTQPPTEPAWTPPPPAPPPATTNRPPAEPVFTQPPPEPVFTQPPPEPVFTQPPPEPVYTEPVWTQPLPEPVRAQPAPGPVAYQAPAQPSGPTAATPLGSPSFTPPPPPSVPVPAEAEEGPPDERPPSGFRNAVEWVAIVAGALVVALVIKTFLLSAFYIPSESMTPTLKVGDRVMVNKVSYDLHAIHRGDIVVFKRPPGESGDPSIKDLIKRVIALPGETIESREGQVYIGGRLLSEPYLPRGTQTLNLPLRTIPADQYFVMGDNRTNSKDSRFIGPIPGSLIVGRAFIRVWPLSALSLL